MRVLKLLVIFVLLVLTCYPAMAVTLPVEVIAPRPGLTTANYWNRAYPGLTYNRKVSVIHGQAPFKYSLVTAPTGMTIDQDTGVINWPNAGNCGSPGCVPQFPTYNVSVRVTGADNQSNVFPWTITVTTNHYAFLSPTGTRSTCNGGTNPTPIDPTYISFGGGSYAHPYLEMNDIWCSTSASNRFTDFIMILRNGTYDLQGWQNYNAGSSGITKPVVWTGYEGETARIDFNSAGTASRMWYFGSGAHNLTFDHLTFVNIPTGAAIVAGEMDNFTMRRTTWNKTLCGNTNNNESFFLSETMTVPFSHGYMSFTENNFLNVCHGVAFELYAYRHINIELNNLSGFSGGSVTSGIHLKAEPQFVDVKHNRVTGFNNATGIQILIVSGSDCFSGTTHTGQSCDQVIRFNYLNNNSINLALNPDLGNYPNQDVGGVEIYSNTFISTAAFSQSANITIKTLTATAGQRTNIHHNVILDNPVNGHIYCLGCATAYLTIGSNIMGLPTVGDIVDSSGNLTSKTPCATGFPNACNSYVGYGSSGGFGSQTAVALSAPTGAEIE